MKLVILAGGLGTRISEESYLRPKPMIEIGGLPILWHIMKIYSHHGVTEFVICCGYKSEVIKDFFSNFFYRNSDFTIDIGKNEIKVHDTSHEPWIVTLVDTGLHTQTGGRIERVKDYLDDTFCLTYGDGLANVDVRALIDFHYKNGRKCTLTAVQPAARFGALQINDDQVTEFDEKPIGDNSWINGGFFVCNKSVIDLIDGEDCIWERKPLSQLAHQGELSAYKHHDFWMPMDTMRDQNALQRLWQSGEAPWKLWK